LAKTIITMITTKTLQQDKVSNSIKVITKGLNIWLMRGLKINKNKMRT
jgi:hypothetical protein